VNILDVTGLVLAGGMGRRMGGVDKGLVLLDGRPMVAHVIERLTKQVVDRQWGQPAQIQHAGTDAIRGEPLRHPQRHTHTVAERHERERLRPAAPG